MVAEPDDAVEAPVASPELALVDPALAQELRLDDVAEEAALVDEELDGQPSETDWWDAEDSGPLPDFIV